MNKPKDSENLNTVFEQLEEEARNFSKEGFLNGLRENNFSISKVQRLITEARFWHSRILTEYDRLYHFSNVFNSEFATDYNDCFNSTQLLLNRLRSTMAGSRKTAKSFGKKLKNKYHYFDTSNDKKWSPSKKSHILSKPSEGMVFDDFEYCERCVIELFDELSAIYRDLIITLRLCNETILKELLIKSDPSRSLRVYDNSCQKVDHQIESTILQMKDLRIILDSEMSTKLRQSNSVGEFACEALHAYTVPQFHLHRIVEQLEYCRYSSITPEELYLFGQDKDKVLQVRSLIDNFDQLCERGRFSRNSNKYKLDPYSIVWLMEWAGIIVPEVDKKNRKEARFLQYFGNRYQGEYEQVAISTINEAKNNRKAFTAEIVQKKAIFLTRVKSILNKNKCLPSSFRSEIATNRI